LRDALVGAGLADIPRQLLIPGDYIGYLEAHIEQGDYLKSSDLRLGIVTGMVGIYLYRVTGSRTTPEPRACRSARMLAWR
jgi:beta-ureidopropionase / N-carbamoyl-L-amino-acid hydrolase